MDTEDNVVDLGDVTVPESSSAKPAQQHIDPSPAPGSGSADAAQEPTTLDVDEANPWKRPSDNASMDQDEVEQARAAKKPRTEIMRDTSSKNRGMRMMGLLKGTLSKFKDEGSKSGRTDAAKRRQEVEDRLRAKLRAEQEVSERKNERVKTERNLKNELLHRQDEKAVLEQIYKKRQTTTLHLANFLCTTVAATEAQQQQGQEHRGSAARPALLADQLPLHAHPAVQPSPPIYFKPYKLLPDQAARVENQLAEARKAVDADKEAWKGESAELEAKIEEAARNKERFEEERERQDREERLRERRERGDGDHDDDDDDDGNTKEDEEMGTSRRSPSKGPSTAVEEEDVNME